MKSLLPLLLAFTLLGCVDASVQFDLNQTYSAGTITQLTEPYPTTNTNYAPNTADNITPIKTLVGYVQREQFGWIGLSNQGSQNNFDRYRENIKICGTFNNKVEAVSQLPAVIEGVVTIHPRYYKKIRFCGFDSKNYGSFFIQDSTGGILVTRDTRIADFDLGDTIKITVKGLAYAYGQPFVMIGDDIKVVKKRDAEPKTSIYTKEIEINELPQYENKVVTVRGKVVEPPSNKNFNSACIIPVNSNDETPCQGDCLNGSGGGKCRTLEKAYLSIDKEIGQRNPYPIKKGDIIEVTGPTYDGYNGFEIAVSRVGQYKHIK